MVHEVTGTPISSNFDDADGNSSQMAVAKHMKTKQEWFKSDVYMDVVHNLFNQTQQAAQPESTNKPKNILNGIEESV